MHIKDLIEIHADNLRIVWDDENMQPVRELVYLGQDTWEVRQTPNYRNSIIETKDFDKALEKLINP